MRRVKIIASLLIGAMAVQSAAFAENVYDKVIDYRNGSIVFSGKTDKVDVPITIQAFKDNKTTDDFTENISGASDYVIYVGQTITDESGNFSFKFDYKGDSAYKDENDIEKLNLCFVYNDTKEEEKYSLSFIDKTKYDAVISDINGAADLAAFTESVNKYSFLFDLDTDMAEDINKEALISKLYNDVTKTPLNSSDSSAIKKRGINFIVIQKVSENKLNSILDFADNMNISEDLKKDIEFFVKDSVTDTKFASILNGKKLNTQSELEDYLKEAMILTAVKYPQGFSNLKRICEKYSSLIGISGKNYSSSVYSKVAGSDNINTINALKNALENADDSDSNGSYNGGSHGGGSAGGGSSTVSVSGGTTTDNKKPTINMPFNDMAGFEWAHIAVSTLSDKGIVNGKGDNNFYPSDYVTREEFVKLIIGAAGIDTKSLGNVFDDVNSDEWYAGFVNAAYKNNICKGIGDNLFGVGENITREDAAVMIYNMLSKQGLSFDEDRSFNDSNKISDYAARAVAKLGGKNIVNGDENNNFNPDDMLSRAEAAQLIFNCLEYLN